ncbi:hypothetical protein T439DRAFT_378867 [Meredithblackwellia eburnea MCA 4105]
MEPSTGSNVLPPSITLDSPVVSTPASPVVTQDSQQQAATGSSSSRSRSLSRTSPPSSPMANSTTTPRPSRIIASRPSPVVPSPSLPASPSFSRPTSPRPPKDRVASQPPAPAALDEPSSPTRSALEVPLSGSTSAGDFTHIFERDVEFSSAHQLSAPEAVDVAIPPVLDEAVLELSASEELSSRDLASLVRESEDFGSGWSSPVTPARGVGHLDDDIHGYSSASRSPTRGGRSFSPDSASSASGRATSPESSTSFSVGTPGSSPPGSFVPFNQHLADALETEVRKKPLFPLGLKAPPNLAVAGAGTGSSPSISTVSGSPSPVIPSPSSAAVPFPSVGGPDALEALTSSAESAALDRRRLSFMSLADIINDERMAELTGSSPFEDIKAGASTPSRAVSAAPLDVASLLKALPTSTSPNPQSDA